MKIDRHSLTLDQRWSLADYLAAKNLPEVNRKSKKVKLRDGIYVRYTKRSLDIAISSVCVVLTLPVNAAIGAITFFDVGRPIFFIQSRTGKDGVPFEIAKFRNMKNTKDERGELLPAAQRVTRFGKFVRKTSLDELLNFWYVLKGDMSIIGPRPLVNEYLTRYSDRHKARLAVRPGLECPPRSMEHPVRTWNDQFENDVWYVENVSFWTDIKMCIRLVQFALDRKNSEARSAVSGKGIFMGYDKEGNAINLDQIPQEDIDSWYALQTDTDSGKKGNK